MKSTKPISHNYCELPEGNDPRRARILAIQQVADQGLAIGILFVGLSPGPPQFSTEIIQYEVDDAGMFRRDRRRGTHDQLPEDDLSQK